MPITNYSDQQLIQLIRWIESDTLLRTEDELYEDFKDELGFHAAEPESKQRSTGRSPTLGMASPDVHRVDVEIGRSPGTRPSRGKRLARLRSVAQRSLC